MYDYVRSSFPLSEDFEGECVTRDIDPWAGGTLSLYWIAPDGRLFYVSYARTADFETVDGLPTGNILPSGVHGRVIADRMTSSIKVRPMRWSGPMEQWPCAKLHFTDGILHSFSIINGNLRRSVK